MQIIHDKFEINKAYNYQLKDVNISDHPSNDNTLDINLIQNYINNKNDSKFVNLILYNEKKCCCPSPKILMNDPNNFTIEETSSNCLISSIIISILILFPPIIIMIIYFSLINLIGISCLLIILLVSIMIIGFNLNYDTHITLNSDSISINKRKLFRKKIQIYSIGEIKEIGIEYELVETEDSEADFYNFYLNLTSGEKEIFCHMQTKGKNINMKGINFMINIINNHIRKNEMKG